MKKPLPIGNDEFTEVREQDYYYVDKSLMIRDFFDINKDSEKLFAGLSIMETECAEAINSIPVIFMTFKDCKGRTGSEMFTLLKKELYREYLRYEAVFRNVWEENSYEKQDFYSMINTLRDKEAESISFVTSLQDLTVYVKNYYKVAPILLIDEYDQPIMSSYEYGYHAETETFFSNFYGKALKGNPCLGQALLTGIQRVAKESIFSQLNNPQIYTVIDKEYAGYFGLNEEETKELLSYYGLKLTEDVKKMYDGYQIGGLELYNPWSILNYAKKGRLENFWVRTSSNFLIKEAMAKADQNFWTSFDLLASGNETTVWLTLDTSFVERESNYSLWGLLANAGYVTVTKWINSNSAAVRIPNGEVMAEFQTR